MVRAYAWTLYHICLSRYFSQPPIEDAMYCATLLLLIMLDAARESIRTEVAAAYLQEFPMNDAQTEKIQKTFSGIVTLLENVGTLISDDGFGKVASLNQEIFEALKKVIDDMLSVEDVVAKNYTMALDCVGMLKEEQSSDVLKQMRLQIIELALKTNTEASQTIYTNLHKFTESIISGIEINKMTLSSTNNIEKKISETNVAIMDIMKEMNET